MSGEEHYEQFDPYDDPYGEEEVVALEEVEGSSVPEPIPVGVEANPRYFNQIESDVLLERYVENYDIFHHAMSGATRQGLQAKKKFIMDLTEEINALGYVRRTEKQIEQRIRDEIKVLKKYGNAVRSEMSRTGGGRVVVPRLTAAQLRAYNALQDRPRVSGLSTGIEVGARELPTTSEEPAPVLVEPSRPRPIEPSRPRPIEPSRPRPIEPSRPRPIEPSRPGPSRVGSIEGSRPSSRSTTLTSESQAARSVSQREILNLEMSNLELRRETLTKKNKVLDLQIKYWTKKADQL